LCRRASVAQFDAGPLGAQIAFRNGTFSNPDALVKFIAASRGLVKLQPAGGPAKAGKPPEVKLLFKAEWDTGPKRMKGARGLLTELAAMAEAG
ncbi:MAG: hypothetical protein R3D67_19895, partial [Hyphomicrobiaceae bacterium]